ncbi:hypothetical protein [Sediminibacterium soli]|uniref:hypothetical protein n=1 Tax=Sediminibacterium soli TaxID=2698829 RepID=UPI00137AEC58|nr:hypothetical protein [Sediminibacterium soli]NCI46377.1 hypothetical protein [Sediminibacterium soli]
MSIGAFSCDGRIRTEEQKSKEQGTEEQGARNGRTRSKGTEEQKNKEQGMEEQGTEQQEAEQKYSVPQFFFFLRLTTTYDNSRRLRFPSPEFPDLTIFVESQ